MTMRPRQDRATELGRYAPASLTAPMLARARRTRQEARSSWPLSSIARDASWACACVRESWSRLSAALGRALALPFAGHRIQHPSVRAQKASVSLGFELQRIAWGHIGVISWLFSPGLNGFAMLALSCCEGVITRALSHVMRGRDGHPPTLSAVRSDGRCDPFENYPPKDRGGVPATPGFLRAANGPAA